MEIVHKPLSILLILFIIFFLNLATFSDSRATVLANHNKKHVTDKPKIIYRDLRPTSKPVDPPPRGSVGFPGAKIGKDDQDGDTVVNELTQDSYGASYDYGYQNTGGIFGFPRGFLGFPRGLFGFPRGLFGFPRGLFGFPRGIFGFPRGIFGFPGGYGGYPGGYGGYSGGYGGYSSRYGGGRLGDKPGGGGYGGKSEVKGK